MLLEAWSAEKPVVACDVGGLSENIDMFVNGIKVHPDPNSLAWGITTTLSDPVNAQVLGRRGRSKVDHKFLWNPVAQRMSDTYSRVSG